MITDKDNKPPTGGMGGSVHGWERAKDPFHRDAFKGTGITDEQLDNAVVIGGGGVSAGSRKEGWMALDWCGNEIGFVPDGTEIKEASDGCLAEEKD